LFLLGQRLTLFLSIRWFLLSYAQTVLTGLDPDLLKFYSEITILSYDFQKLEENDNFSHCHAENHAYCKPHVLKFEKKAEIV
jgi:hypothetical protein